jgi:hypothetical protein
LQSISRRKSLLIKLSLGKNSMDQYHQGPSQHISPSGFPGLLLIALAIGGLWVLLRNPAHFYVAISGFTVLGAILAIFLRKYFRRQSRAEEISLLYKTEQDSMRY